MAIRILVLTLAVSGWAGLACAELAVVEEFNYAIPQGAGALEGKGGGSGWAGLWEVPAVYNTYDRVLNPGLWGPIEGPSGYDGGAVQGGYAAIDGVNGTASLERRLATPIDFSPAVDRAYYFSMLFRRYETTDGAGTEMVRFFDLRSAADPGLPLLIAGATSAEQAWLVLGGYGQEAIGSGVVYDSTLRVDFLDTGHTRDYLLVVKLSVSNAANDVVKMKIYEAGVETVGSEPLIWDLSYSNHVSGQADRLIISIQDYGGDLHFDQIRIGSSWADVVGTID